MSNARRATIYFDPAVHQALRMLAAATDRTISQIVNDAVKRVLIEEGADPELLRDESSRPSPGNGRSRRRGDAAE